MSQVPDSKKPGKFWFGIGGVAFVGAIAAALSSEGVRPAAPASASTVVQPVFAAGHPAFNTNPPGIVDRTIRYETPDAFATGTFESTNVASDAAARIVLNDTRERDFPRQGAWTTPIVEAELPFTEFLPSWNATVPADTGVVFDVRVRSGKTWSPWIYIGSWGKTPNETRVEKYAGGRIDTDNLQLTQPADAFQMRVRFDSYSINPDQVPALRRLRVVYSGLPAESERAKWAQPNLIVTGWDKDLAVPFRPQGDAPPSLSYQLCSPTSTSMVLNYWGVDRPTVENAMAIWDVDHSMFGNWGRAVQYAGSLGLDAWLERFRNWDQVKAKIAAGQPVIASIKFKVGEFPSSALKKSNGHLIVIRGFTPTGDAICNDPGSRARGNGIVYKASELGHAWFDHGGVGYIIHGNAAMTTQPSTRPAVAVK